MEARTVERKLTAIFAADVEGYSRLMGIDEGGTLQTRHVSPRDMRTHPIGTGPFKFAEFKPNERITVTRNPDLSAWAFACAVLPMHVLHDEHLLRVDVEVARDLQRLVASVHRGGAR